MKISIKRLKKLIKEYGVDDTLRNTAGYFMAGGVSTLHSGDGKAEPLGDEECQEKQLDDDNEENLIQPGVKHT
jgi:hypothetical protein